MVFTPKLIIKEHFFLLRTEIELSKKYNSYVFSTTVIQAMTGTCVDFFQVNVTKEQCPGHFQIIGWQIISTNEMGRDFLPVFFRAREVVLQ